MESLPSSIELHREALGLLILFMFFHYLMQLLVLEQLRNKSPMGAFYGRIVERVNI